MDVVVAANGEAFAPFLSCFGNGGERAGRLSVDVTSLAKRCWYLRFGGVRFDCLLLVFF